MFWLAFVPLRANVFHMKPPNPTSNEPIFVSVKEAATLLRVTPWQVYKLLDDQEIRSQYLGKRRLVRLESLHAYADALPEYRDPA